MKFKDYYQTMDVERTATPEAIKKAHRKLARKYHPDVSKEKDAEARFKELAEAYDVLKDPEKRSSYDQLGANYKAGQDFSPPPGWAGQQHGGAFTRGDHGDHSEFFESLFREMGKRETGGWQHQHPHEVFDRHGQDQHAKIQIRIEDSYLGATRTIELRMPMETADSRMQMQNRSIEFVIPKGIRAGQHIRLQGQGSPGMGRGSPGDLYLDVAFLPHPLYRTDGYDVSIKLPVAPWEAALGAEVEAPTPTGWVEVKIPPGSVTGRKLRIKGRGLPASGTSTAAGSGRPPGDFYFVLQTSLPPAITDAEKQAYTDMAAAFRAFDPRSAIDAMDKTLESRV